MSPCYKIPATILLSSLAAAELSAAPAVDDIQSMKTLQSKVRKVVKKVLPATVSLFSRSSGASGSGVIVNEDGLILTAGHVVRGSEEMTVVFPNGKEAKGKVLGANYTRDAAMIQILDPKPTAGWPHAEVGESKNLASGDLVIALGHAGGFDPVRTPPVRFGRVIARGPDTFLSSDCALIGGDSGGPLFDLDGRVIGIHSSIGVSLAANNHAGIEGFHRDWDKLKRGDTWGRLGGSSLLDNPDAPVIGIITGESRRGGVGIRQVIKGGPGDAAGLRAGDIILSINAKSIPSLRRLHVTIAQFKPGDIISVGIARGNETLVRRVKLGRRGNILPKSKP